MSYDIRLGVKVEGADDLYAVIARPEYDSPTYNIGAMFRACTGWDFEQGVWYKVSEVLPLIQHGISELEWHEPKYRKYNAPNGWGTTGSALEALRSLEACIRENAPESSITWNEIPLDLMYVRW
ncbi:MAG: hypothetical protein IKD01_05405 [Oscillospiraceae bacterium]|nr:hypothetical protein [Oscillospiraceae bacterium]